MVKKREIPILTAEEVERHRDGFAEFCRLKIDVNGPDVHMKMAGVGTEGIALRERMWWFGIYTNLCSTPPAAAIWARWPLDRALEEGDELEGWLRENWAGLPVRKNRRPVRSPAKLARGILGYARWLDSEMSDPVLNWANYDSVWNSVSENVIFFGRYATIKLLEVFRRYVGFDKLVAPDIRANGGWSPRKCLAFLYPEHGRLLVQGGNSREAIGEIHALAAQERLRVSKAINRDVSFYELEALLCNYRQTLSGTFYVGRTIDSELAYYLKVATHFARDPYVRERFDFFGTRKRVFPRECLGEFNMWEEEVRKDLFGVYAEYGYLWSDRVYDYARSKADLAHPVRRVG